MTEQGRPLPVAKDLTVEEPRPMDASLAGYPWLPRMIDKARAANAGTLGSYYRYPCPIDRVCLERLGITAQAFLEISAAAPTDEAIVQDLRAAGAALASLAMFDPVALNSELHGPGS